MAQVTMSSQEFRQLQSKADRYDSLYDEVLKNHTVVYEADRSWQPVSVEIKNDWNVRFQKVIATRIAEQCAESDVVMTALYSDKMCIYDVIAGAIKSLGWEERLFQGQYDMRELSAEFAAKWQALVDQKKDVEEEE